MPNELKDITIDMISLVKRGANDKTVILKSVDAAPDFERQIPFLKAAPIDGVVFGVVYAPDQVDLQGDFAKADEIKKAAYGFMKGINQSKIDANHDGQPRAAYIVESWIKKGADPLFPNEPDGSWVVGVKLEDENLLKSVSAGEITGFSMAGRGKRTPGEIKKASTPLSQPAALSVVEGPEVLDMQRQLASLKAEIESMTTKAKTIDEQLNAFVKSADVNPELDKIKKQLEAIEAHLQKSRQNVAPQGGDDAIGLAIAAKVAQIKKR